MTAAQALTRWIDDRLNPVVVKELRQAVRSRAVSVILILFLTVQLLAIGVYLLAADDVANDFYAGQTVFMILESALLAVCLLFVPAYVGFRMAGERSDTNVDLLFITTIRPRSILWGKFVSGTVVTALIYSACAPFMVLTYMLRGIDLPSIAVVLALNLVAIFVSMQLALLIGAMHTTRVLKSIMGVLFFVVLVIGYILALQGAFGLVFFGIGGMLGTWEFWGPALGVFTLAATATGLLFTLSVAVISPPASNRAMPVRVFVSVAWLLTAVCASAMAWMMETGVPMVTWLTLVCWLLALTALGASGEREVYGSRLRRRVPRRWWARVLVYPFFSGAGAGLWWAGWMTLLTALVGGVLVGWMARGGGWSAGWSSERLIQEVLTPGMMMILYSGAYVLTAALIRRRFLPRRLPTTVTPLLALALAAVLSLVPPLVAFFMSPTQWHRMDAHWAMPNPVAGYLFIDEPAMQSQALHVVVAWLMIAAALNVPWLLEQWRRFKPLEAELVEEGGDGGEA